MSDNKCKWKPPFPWRDYAKCSEPPLPEDRHGYCLLHSENKNKSIKEFTKKVEQKIKIKNDIIDLRGCYFPTVFDSFDFKQLCTGKIILFNWAVFSDGAILARSTFPAETHFNGATFSNKATFINATFKGVVEFNDATFEKGADFLNTTFLSSAEFSKTTFKGELTNFREATFENDVNFSATQFNSTWVSFSDTAFIKEGEVDFNNPTFDCQVYFIKTKFDKYCKFRWAEFPRTHKQAVFQDTDLRKCSFLHSSIDKVDFRYCEFNKDKPDPLFGIRLLDRIIPHSRQNVLKDEIDADQGEKKYEPVRRLYLELKKNFEDKRDWNTAGDFHYGEMECRRKMYGWSTFEGFLVNIYFWLSGYGERPLRAAASLFILIGFCTVVYMYFEDLAFLKSGCNSLKIASLQKIGIGEVHEPDSLPAKFLSVFESIMGPILIALFALALRRKMKR